MFLTQPVSASRQTGRMSAAFAIDPTDDALRAALCDHWEQQLTNPYCDDADEIMPITMTLEQERGGSRSFHFNAVKDQMFGPLMTYTALVNTLTSYERQFGTATYAVQGRLQVRNHEPITFDNVFTGGAGIGWKHQWFRADLTIDYGTGAKFLGNAPATPSYYSMKIDAATFSDSAPLAPITLFMTTANRRTTTCIRPK